MIKEKTRLWATVLREKYCEGKGSIKAIKAEKNSSNAWRGITTCVTTLEEGCKRLIRNGKETRFWIDPWLIDVPLRQLACKDVSLSDTYAMVTEFWIQEMVGTGAI